MATPIATAAVQIVPTFKGLHTQTRKGLEGSEREFDKSGKKSGSLLSKAFSGVAKAGVVATGAAIATGFGMAMAKGFQRLNAIDQAEKKLQGLGHSTKTVDQIMQNALASVKGTAFGLDEAATVSASLVASGIKPGQELEKTLKTVADAATIAGIDMGDMGAIFGKVAATGKLQGDELNQLSERGIPALQLLSDHLGITTDEVRKMVSKGQVDFKTFAAAMDAGMGGAALKSGETFMGAWKNVQAALGRIGATLLKPIFDALRDSFNVLTPALDQIQAAVEPLAQAFGDMLKSAMPLATTVFTGLVKIFVALAETLGKNAGLVKALTGIVVFAAAAYAGWASGAKILVWYQTLHKMLTPALTAVLKGQVTVTGLLSKGWAALSAAMAANPVGAVIVALLALGAIFVIMYKKVGWFRDAVNAAWAGIKSAIDMFVEWFKANILPAINQALSALGVAVKWLYESIIKPYLSAAGTYFTFLWNVVKAVFSGMVWYIQNVVAPVYVWLYENVIKPVFGALKTYFTVWWDGVKLIFQGLNLFFRTIVGPVFTWLYQSIIKPVFAGIQTAVIILWNAIKLYFTALVAFYKNVVGPVFVWLYQNVVKPVFAGIKLVIQVWWTAVKLIFNALVIFFRAVLAPVFRWLLNSVVRPVFNTIKAVIQFWWTGVKAIFNACMSFIRHVLAPAFRWFLNNVIRPVWNGVKSVINAVWVFIRDKVFGPMKNAIKTHVPNAFRTGVDAIKRFWDRLKDVAKSPVKFVIQTVLNNGLIKKFNEIAGKFPGTPKLDPVKLPKGFAGGGWTGPGARLTPAGIVHADEFVIKKSSRRRFEADNPGLLDHINRTGRLPMFGGYAGGGKVGTLSDAARWLQSLGVRISEFKAWGQRVGRHAPNSYHYSGKAFDANYGPGGQNSTEMAFFDRIVPQLHKKFPTLRTIWRAPGHYNHLHVDTGRGGSVGSTGPGGSGGGFSLDTILSPFTKMRDKLKDQFTKWGDIGKLTAGMARKTIGVPIDWIKKNAAKFVGDIGSKVTDVVSGVKDGVTQTRARAVAATYGWGSGAEWEAIKWLVNKESSWNPRAANPRSSARGLFQKMTCLVTDAEILTREGWKRHDEVQPGDETIGYNPETGRNEWTRVKRVVHYDNAPIVHMRNGRVAYRSTPNHRWLTEQRRALGTERMVETQDLNVGHRLIVAAPAAIPAELDITTAEAALIGWLLSDGTLRMPGLPDGLDGREPVGHLYQSKPHMIPVIEALLDEAVGDYGHTEREPRGKATLPAHTWRLRASDVRSLVARARLEDGLERFVTRLSMEQRTAFLTAVKQAEGTPVMYGGVELWRIPQLDGPKQDAFIMAAYLDGHKPLVNSVDTSRSEFTARPLSQVMLASPTVGVQSLTFETDPDLYDVWCVETELGTWTARDLGQVFLTGNSIHGPVDRTIEGQTKWGLNYIKNRYGSPTRAMAFWRRNNWYADGGHVKYDQGGWLMPGITNTLNATGKPEAVFTNEQFQHIKAAALGGGRGLTIETLQAMDMDDAIRRLAVYEQRRRVLYPEGV